MDDVVGAAAEREGARRLKELVDLRIRKRTRLDSETNPKLEELPELFTARDVQDADGLRVESARGEHDAEISKIVHSPVLLWKVQGASPPYPSPSAPGARRC